MRRRAFSTREALKRHSWAIGMIKSRNPGRRTCETTTR